jgi:hypothetical protein
MGIYKTISATSLIKWIWLHTISFILLVLDVEFTLFGGNNTCILKIKGRKSMKFEIWKFVNSEIGKNP